MPPSLSRVAAAADVGLLYRLSCLSLDRRRDSFRYRCVYWMSDVHPHCSVLLLLLLRQTLPYSDCCPTGCTGSFKWPACTPAWSLRRPSPAVMERSRRSHVERLLDEIAHNAMPALICYRHWTPFFVNLFTCRCGLVQLLANSRICLLICITLTFFSVLSPSHFLYLLLTNKVAQFKL